MEAKAGLRRIYRKSWPFDNLFGSAKFELDAAQWGIFNWLIDFAKLSRVEPGIIAPAKDTAYTHIWLAQFFNVPLELFEGTLDALKKTERIRENGSGIKIVNWEKYQSEYDRQKPFREQWREKAAAEGPEEEPKYPVSKGGKPDPEAQAIWQKALEELGQQVSKSNYRTWFEKTVGLEYKDGQFIIGAPNSFVIEHLEKNSRSLIEKSLSGLVTEGTQVLFQIKGTQAKGKVR